MRQHVIGSITAIALLNFAAQARAKELTPNQNVVNQGYMTYLAGGVDNRFAIRALNSWLVRRADLDNTALGKAYPPTPNGIECNPSTSLAIAAERAAGSLCRLGTIRSQRLRFDRPCFFPVGARCFQENFRDLDMHHVQNAILKGNEKDRKERAAVFIAAAGPSDVGRAAQHDDVVLVRFNCSLTLGSSPYGEDKQRDKYPAHPRLSQVALSRFISLGNNAGLSPISLELGAGHVLPRFEKALHGMTLGQRITVTVPPEEAFGFHDKALVVMAKAEDIPRNITVGMRLDMSKTGLKGTVVDIPANGGAVLDFNSPYIGRALEFDVELVGFKEKPRRGLDMVGWAGRKLHLPHAISNSLVSKVFRNPKWEAAWPYTTSDFRQAEYDSEPNFGTYMDEFARGAIKAFYAVQFAQAPKGEHSILDTCSSWSSHYPEGLSAQRVAITGLSKKELAANRQATEYVVRNLNTEPTLPFGDNEFDFVTNTAGFNYLDKPREVFTEIHRILKPGGVATMAFTNRCFERNAIAMWAADLNDGPGHAQIVGNYFRFGPEGGWNNISSADLSLNPNDPLTDQVWVVTAVKA